MKFCILCFRYEHFPVFIVFTEGIYIYYNTILIYKVGNIKILSYENASLAYGPL